MRSAAADERRRQREERTRLRELERLAKEMAKLSALEQARIDVQTREAEFAALLTVHKDVTEAVDWYAISASLGPPEPLRRSHKELRAKQDELLARAGLDRFRTSGFESASVSAALEDDADYKIEMERWSASTHELQKSRYLALRILSGDCDGYREVLDGLNLFEESPDVRAQSRFLVHDRHTVECVMTVDGTGIIPTETRSLTSTGKVSSKALSKGRFHEIYQDYVCSCALRAARDVFAILPIDLLVVTAEVKATDALGVITQRPALSALVSRDDISSLNFDTLDPSDTIEALPHRGSVRLSKRNGDFQEIIPFGIDDVPKHAAASAALSEVLTRMRAVHRSIASEIASLTQGTESSPANSDPFEKQ